MSAVAGRQLSTMVLPLQPMLLLKDAEEKLLVNDHANGAEADPNVTVEPLHLPLWILVDIGGGSWRFLPL